MLQDDFESARKVMAFLLALILENRVCAVA